MLTRRAWLLNAAIACGGAAIGPALPRFAGSRANGGLISATMMGFVNSQRVPDLVVDPVFSTLDRFIIQRADQAADPRGCAQFAFSLTESGIQFNSLFAPQEAARQILTTGNWSWCGGTEHAFALSDNLPADQTIEFGSKLLRILCDHVGVGAAWRVPAAVDPEVMQVAAECERRGALDRQSSPFYHVAFKFLNCQGDWTATGDVVLDGADKELLRIGALLRNAGAREQSFGSYAGVTSTAILTALTDLESVN